VLRLATIPARRQSGGRHRAAVILEVIVIVIMITRMIRTLPITEALTVTGGGVKARRLRGVKRVLTSEKFIHSFMKILILLYAKV
jgi:hypothetical protein